VPYNNKNVIKSSKKFNIDIEQHHEKASLKIIFSILKSHSSISFSDLKKEYLSHNPPYSKRGRTFKFIIDSLIKEGKIIRTYDNKFRLNKIIKL